LAVIGSFTHHDGFVFEFGSAAGELGDKPRHLFRDAGQAIDAGSIQPAGIEEIAIERTWFRGFPPSAGDRQSTSC
jgi:hypothetical protein